MNNLFLCAFLTASCVISISATPWKDCGSPGSKIESVSVNGCENKKICPLKQGHNATVIVKFHTKKAFTKARTVVHGILAGVPIPFPVPNPDGCVDSGLVCPVKNDSENTYTTYIKVRKSYPEVRVVVKWELRDQSSQDIFCMELPAEVVP